MADDRAGLELVEQRRHHVVDLALGLRRRRAMPRADRGRRDGTRSGSCVGDSCDVSFCSFLAAWAIRPRFLGGARQGFAGDHADDFVRAGLRACDIAGDDALADHHDAVGDLEGLRHDVGDDDDADALRRDAARSSRGRAASARRRGPRRARRAARACRPSGRSG